MPRKPGITDEYIIFLFKSEVPYKEMTIKTGLSSRAIHKILCKHNVKMNREQYAGQPRKNKVNEDFFKTWSDEMAWVLRMIVTDGNVYKNTITIAQKDERILKRIAQCMNAEYVISSKSTNNSVAILIVNSKEMKKDLSILGIHPKKSLTISFPIVPEQYLPAFIRGVIDGDGWVDREGYSMNITTGSITFATGLVSVFKSWGLEPKLSRNISKNENIIFKVWVTKKERLRKLADIIYKDAKDLFVYYKRDFMTSTNLHLYNNSDKKRVKFRTNISKTVLENLKRKADDLNTHPNHLIENGLKNLLSMEKFLFTKFKRPDDRIQFKTTYDNELLNRVKKYAKTNNVFINDLIEISVNYINIKEFRKEKTNE